jgi:hypothetical protein
VAVGDQLLPFVQADLFAGPVHVVTATVGEIDELGLLHSHNPSVTVIKILVVVGYGVIMGSCFFQLFGRSNSAGNH